MRDIRMFTSQKRDNASGRPGLRVPTTEAGGRIHTSAATVAVLPARRAEVAASLPAILRLLELSQAYGWPIDSDTWDSIRAAVGASADAGGTVTSALPADVCAGFLALPVLAVLAWRALDTESGRDRLGSLLVVQLFGLLVSPISWTHHWIWLVPLMIWLLHGHWRTRPGARFLGWGWLVLTLIGVPWLLSFAQPTIWEIGRPWYLAWSGLVYIAATLGTLAWIAVTGRRESGLYPRPTRHPAG
jgi:hypothetical protein